jgi:hypothetical protein
MKLFTAIFFTASLVSLHALVAQDATSVPIPDNSGTAAPTPSPLFPNGTPPPVVGKPHRAGGENNNGGPSFLNPTAKKQPLTNEDVDANIKYRKAETIALHDEKIQQARADVDAAKIDPDKRAAWKQYYTLLSQKILKIDGSIKKLVAERLKESLKQLDQRKVRPEEYPEQASAAQ